MSGMYSSQYRERTTALIVGEKVENGGRSELEVKQATFYRWRPQLGSTVVKLPARARSSRSKSRTRCAGLQNSKKNHAQRGWLLSSGQVGTRTKDGFRLPRHDRWI